MTNGKLSQKAIKEALHAYVSGDYQDNLDNTIEGVNSSVISVGKLAYPDTTIINVNDSTDATIYNGREGLVDFYTQFNHDSLNLTNEDYFVKFHEKDMASYALEDARTEGHFSTEDWTQAINVRDLQGRLDEQNEATIYFSNKSEELEGLYETQLENHEAEMEAYQDSVSNYKAQIGNLETQIPSTVMGISGDNFTSGIVGAVLMAAVGYAALRKKSSKKDSF
tara:strand:- start:45 stop:713 length:669 start_codon:yes stop_codon:yes gene_type:complete